MPPERYAGQNHDPRSDLYAVGVVLYRLLTGHRPFDNTKNRSVILKRLVTEDVAPPNEGPPALASFCARLLSRDPNDRPQTALEALEELEAIEEEYLSFLRAGEDLNEKPLKSESSAKPVLILAFILAALVLIAVILALTLSNNQETPNLPKNDSPAVISVYIASEPDAEVWVDAEVLPDAALQQEPDAALKIELEKSEQPKNKAQKITAPPKSPAPKTSKRSLSRTPNRTATQDPFIEPSH